MSSADALAVHELAMVAFADLARRLHEDPGPKPEAGAALVRITHLIDTDSGGAWVAEEEGRMVGAALALVREGLWGLSLLVVEPARQSAGIGRALLERSLAHGDGAVRGGVILASPDPRALRAYARAGFAAHPCFDAAGHPRGVAMPSGVRTGSPADLPLTERVDRAVRGAAHGADIAALLRAGCRLLVMDGRGYVAARGGEIKLLAALDDEAARDLLRAALASTPPDAEAEVEWITSSQAWAVEPVLDAGLELRIGGGVFLRGDVGPFRPYLPSGAYL